METAVRACYLAISNSTETQTQIKAYISQPAFLRSRQISFLLNIWGNVSDFERLSPISQIQEMKPFFSNCYFFTLISIQSYSCCTLRSLEVSFSIILYAQSFDKYNVIHGRTYLMEKKMIPPSELCLPSDITLNAGRAARQVGNWSVCHTLPRSRHFSFQQPKGIRKQSEPMQAKRDFRSRNFEKVRWGTVLWTLVPRNCHQAYQMLTTKNKWMLAISLFHFRSEACLNHSSTMNSVALNYIVSLAFLSKIRRRLIIFFFRSQLFKRVHSAYQGIWFW